MNPFVKKQLQKCRTPLPEWDDLTTQLIIPLHTTYTEASQNTEVIINIQQYIINEPPNFTLSHDWNNDTVPPETQMRVKCVSTRGKMTKISGRGINTGIPWEGWLPNKCFEVVE